MKHLDQQLTLGDFIKKLESLDQNKDIAFAFCDLTPTEFHSFRGYYDELALGFSEHGSMKVGELLASAKKCIGETFQGWKGGDFEMKESTPIWADQDGRCTNTCIVDVVDTDFKILIVTDFEK